MAFYKKKPLKGKKIAVIQGGPGPEKEISYKTARCVEKALQTLPCSHFTVEADHNLFQTLQREKPDLAFLAVHGIFGEDGCVQALCELLQIPYTSSGILASALCMDKLFFKHLLLKNKIPTPSFKAIPPKSEDIARGGDGLHGRNEGDSRFRGNDKRDGSDGLSGKDRQGENDEKDGQSKNDGGNGKDKRDEEDRVSGSDEQSEKDKLSGKDGIREKDEESEKGKQGEEDGLHGKDEPHGKDEQNGESEQSGTDGHGRIPPVEKYPVVVKASHGGSTLGTYIVKNSNDLSIAVKKAADFGRSVFLEDYIPSGKEIAVSFLNGRFLTPVEIVPKSGFYDYKSKYEAGQTDYILPPRLDPLVTEKLKFISEKVIALTNVRGYARLDFIVEENGTAWLLEVNTLPGLTETSLLPKSAKYDGINFPELIEIILSLAETDYPRR